MLFNFVLVTLMLGWTVGASVVHVKEGFSFDFWKRLIVAWILAMGLVARLS